MKITMDKKYSFRSGEPAEVLTVTRNNRVYPVIAMSPDGSIYFLRETGRGYSNEESPYDLIEVSEWDDFKDGEPVMVSEQGSERWEKRYFAGVKAGIPCCYISGQTKWSSDGYTSAWAFCRRPTKEELGE